MLLLSFLIGKDYDRVVIILVSNKEEAPVQSNTARVSRKVIGRAV